MKSTGIVRKIDKLGRIVLPKELRHILNINQKDPIEIFLEDNHVILKKYEPACWFCNNTDNAAQYKGYNICGGCLKSLKEIEKPKKGNEI